jgi:hypothetical protein
VRLLVVNWQDRENPLAGGAEIHLHEIFERLAARGHEVTMLCGGWPGCPPRAELGGIEVHRTGIRQTFALTAWPYFRHHLAARTFDVLVEDINKMPLYTPLWGARMRAAPVRRHGIPGAGGAARRRRLAVGTPHPVRVPSYAVRGDQREHG